MLSISNIISHSRSCFYWANKSQNTKSAKLYCKRTDRHASLTIHKRVLEAHLKLVITVVYKTWTKRHKKRRTILPLQHNNWKLGQKYFNFIFILFFLKQLTIDRNENVLDHGVFVKRFSIQRIWGMCICENWFQN